MTIVHSTGGELTAVEVAKKTTSALTRIVLYVVVYMLVVAAVQWLLTGFLPQYRIDLSEYSGYIYILLALAFGYLILNGLTTFVYWSLRGRYAHPTAAAVKNVVRIVGLGALISAIAGGAAGGAAGVALGGFLGIVIGFASQHVLGQAIAGLFILISRPFRIGDEVVVAGEEGRVEDISTLFTTIVRDDGTRVIIPNNTILGSKIYLKAKASE